MLLRIKSCKRSSELLGSQARYDELVVAEAQGLRRHSASVQWAVTVFQSWGMSWPPHWTEEERRKGKLRWTGLQSACRKSQWHIIAIMTHDNPLDICRPKSAHNVALALTLKP